jgi:hypothetical protein
MIRDQLQTLLRQRPFQPFRVHLTDGRSYDVPYRGMTLLADTFINIGIPITEGPHPICSHTEHVPFKDIDRIEESISSQPSPAS